MKLEALNQCNHYIEKKMEIGIKTGIIIGIYGSMCQRQEVAATGSWA